MPDERTRRIEKALENIQETAEVKDATQLRGRVRIVTSKNILKIITDIVAAHTGESNTELLTKVTEAEFELLKLRKHLEILQADLQSAREESFAKDTTIRDLTEQLANTISAVERREGEVRRLSDMLKAHDKERDEQVNKLKAEIEQAKKAREAQADPEEMKALREEVSSLQSELRMSEDIEEMLRSEISNLEAQLEKTRKEYEAQIAKLSRGIDKIENELRSSRALEKKLRTRMLEVSGAAAKKEEGTDEFGQTAMKLGYCSAEQLEEAQKIQQSIAGMGLAPPKLPDVLVDKGFITPGQVTEILRAQGPGRPRIEGYEFVSKLGEGLLGSTYKAKQLSLDRDVAVKVIRREFTADREYTAKFLERARQAGRLHHKNVAHIIDAGESVGVFFCIVEYVRGQNLREIIRKKTKLSERQALHIALEITAALAEGHRIGLYHGDIKPSNVMVNTEGVVKLCDFGLVKQVNLETDFSLPHELYEAVYYCSPEVVHGGMADIRGDIYALGASLYNMLTGDYPFGKADTPREALLAHLGDEPPDPRKKEPGINQKTAEMVMRMLESRPENRYQSPDELVGAIMKQLRRDKTAGPVKRALSSKHHKRRPR